MPKSAEEILRILLAKADAGEVAPKQAGTLRHLAQRIADGKPMSEMQEELVRDFGTAYGVE
jgi:hypothetical protein